MVGVSKAPDFRFEGLVLLLKAFDTGDSALECLQLFEKLFVLSVAIF